jgi:hypothetical protein
MVIENRYLSIGAKFGHASKKRFVQVDPKKLLAVFDQGFIDYWILILTVPIRLSIFYLNVLLFLYEKQFFGADADYTQGDEFFFYPLNFTRYGSFLSQILLKLMKLMNRYFCKKH